MTARLVSIQWLRAIAALMVVAHHAVFLANDLRAPDAAPIAGSVPSLPSFGAAGVDLFFVISGFVMAHSIADGRSAGAVTFLLRRAVRILPFFWLASAAFMLEKLPSEAPYSLAQILNSITLFPIFDPTDYAAPPLYLGWTLSFEWIFYMLVAAVIATGLKSRATILLGLTATLAIAGLFTGHDHAWSNVLFNPIIGEFTLGILSWVVWRKGISQGLAAGLTVVAVLLFASGLVIDIGQGFQATLAAVIHGESSLRRLLDWGLPSALLVIGVVTTPAQESRRTRWFTVLGGASYMLYLVHLIVLKAVIHAKHILPLGNPLISAAMMVLVSTGLALLLHRFVEKPLLRRMQAGVDWITARLSRPHRVSVQTMVREVT
ncbi:acyltransferase family protein [Sphingomonas sp. PR090111-T3T-6A]|uniref:acyltransferase family protein n=1 Tax=Sphingomonas sp. PR090111-T3T-6A TaxID=685778 RepID=UPI0003778C22|nr:acyltransferase [Sphingomonas sp. PR090111-T3T-6A]